MRGSWTRVGRLHGGTDDRASLPVDSVEGKDGDRGTLARRSDTTRVDILSNTFVSRLKPQNET
jgi:hypothetical protein